MQKFAGNIWWLIIVAISCSTVIGAGAETATQPATAPATVEWPQSAPPSPAEIERARAFLRATFKEAYDGTPAEDTDLAGPNGSRFSRQDFPTRFYHLGVVLENNAANRYALLCDSRDLAAASGNSTLAMQAIGRLAALFNLSPTEAGDSALEALRVAATANVEHKTDLANDGLLLLEAALASGDYDLAARTAAVCESLPGREKNPCLVALLDEVRKSPLFEHISVDVAAANGARARLKNNPNEPLARLTLEIFNSANRGEWSGNVAKITGVGMSPPEFLNMAIADGRAIAPGTVDASTSAHLADGWREAATRLKGRESDAARRRSAYWERRVASAGGDNALVAKARLADFRNAILRPGLLASLYDGQDFQHPQHLRVDSKIDFNWDNTPPAPGLSTERYSICWDGYLTAPAAGKYALIVRADDGVVVTLEGKKVIDQWHGGSSEYSADVELTGKPQEITFCYFQETGPAHLSVLWKIPSAGDAVVIPPAAFSHEPVWPWGTAAAVTRARLPEAIACKTSRGETWFAKINTELPWHDAERSCERMGGHLAWPRGWDQTQAIEKAAAGSTAWLGANDEIIQYQWEWTNDVRVDPEIFDWREGQPSGNEYFMMLKDGHGWVSANGRSDFICQWP